MLPGMVTPAWMQNWPAQLWLVRHGESSGNVARHLAETGGLSMIDIADRDMDVPLSLLGEEAGARARALVSKIALGRAALRGAGLPVPAGRARPASC
jgi:hypothetical protein